MSKRGGTSEATAVCCWCALFHECLPLYRMEADDEIGELGPMEVAVRMMFAPINPSDINQVSCTANARGFSVHSAVRIYVL